MPISERDEVEVVLDGVVAHLGSSAEHRVGQEEMARAVSEALAHDGHLVVRAGTGIGKSLGYLVPAARSGSRVLIATATKALQDQLAEKDLPLVCEGLEPAPTYAVLKGRSNYLCRQRLAEGAQNEQLSLDQTSGSSRLANEARAISLWANETETGDRTELDFEPDDRVWSAFSVSADECPGAFNCPSGESCFAEAARSAAAEADLIVTNLALLGAHLASGRAVLPEFDALIVDEAHELEDVLGHALGRSLSAGRLRAAAATARSAVGGGGADVDEAIRLVTDAATRLEDVLAGLGDRRLSGAYPDELADVLSLIAERLARLERGVATDDDPAPARLRAQLMIGTLREEVAACATPGDESVAWIEGGPRPSLEVAPIDLAAICAPIFSEMPVVFTSATVPLGLAERLGLEPASIETLAIESPFDYEHHALLYCAAHLPERRSAAFEEAMVDELVALIEAAGGRTLALFTARAVMNRAAEAVAARVDHRVIVQDQMSKQTALAAFAADEATCLFATMGFWQGIDVPGPTLSLVVIDRLPFPRPDEPLAAARRERAGAAGFRAVDLPRAQSLLAQGAGRLIRSATDRGVVAILDGRLATASYRWDLVRALPPMHRTRERSEAIAFLEAIRDGAQ